MWLLRAALVAGSLFALRAAGPLYQEALRQGAEEFRQLEALSSGQALAAYGLVVLAAALFTLACRLPLVIGFAWGPLALAIVPAALAAHLPLVLRFEDADWLNRFYFFDGEPARWVLIALVGVAIGSTLGRREHRRAG
jgi:hypothetical protein